MICPQCKSLATAVVDSRSDDGKSRVRRRRDCASCGLRWTTIEVPRDEDAIAFESAVGRCAKTIGIMREELASMAECVDALERRASGLPTRTRRVS